MALQHPLSSLDSLNKPFYYYPSLPTRGHPFPQSLPDRSKSMQGGYYQPVLPEEPTLRGELLGRWHELVRARICLLSKRMFTPLSSLFILTVKGPKATLSGSDRLARSIRDSRQQAHSSHSLVQLSWLPPPGPRHLSCRAAGQEPAGVAQRRLSRSLFSSRQAQ